MRHNFFYVVLLGTSLRWSRAAVLPAKPEKDLSGNHGNRTTEKLKVEVVPLHIAEPNHIPVPSQTTTTSTDDSGVRIVPHEDENWKNAIIIACTIMASVEIVIVAFMIAHWKKIRWTLRKMNCPCCGSHGNRRQSPDDQAVATEMDSITGNTIPITTVTREHEDMVEISVVSDSQGIADSQTPVVNQIQYGRRGRSSRNGDRQNHCDISTVETHLASIESSDNAGASTSQANDLQINHGNTNPTETNACQVEVQIEIAHA